MKEQDKRARLFLDEALNVLPEIQKRMCDLNVSLFSAVAGMQLFIIHTCVEAGVSKEEFIKMSEFLFEASGQVVESGMKKNEDL